MDRGKTIALMLIQGRIMNFNYHHGDESVNGVCTVKFSMARPGELARQEWLQGWEGMVEVPKNLHYGDLLEFRGDYMDGGKLSPNRLYCQVMNITEDAIEVTQPIRWFKLVVE